MPEENYTSNLPNEDDIGKALRYLSQTDAPYAKSIARVKALEYQIKTIKGLTYLESTGTIAEREAKACSSEKYHEFTDDYETAVLEKETLAAKRKRAELVIEVWRSLNANRRQGS